MQLNHLTDLIYITVDGQYYWSVFRHHRNILSQIPKHINYVIFFEDKLMVSLQWHFKKANKNAPLNCFLLCSISDIQSLRSLLCFITDKNSKELQICVSLTEVNKKRRAVSLRRNTAVLKVFLLHAGNTFSANSDGPCYEMFFVWFGGYCLNCQLEGNHFQQSFVRVYQLAGGSNRAKQPILHVAESLTNVITKGCVSK